MDPKSARPPGVGGADWQSVVREAAPFLGLGSSLCFTVAICVGGGYWLDEALGSGPLFFLAGGAFGMFAAACHVYKIYVLMMDGKR